MNRVNPQTPLSDVLELMQRDGYVLLQNALTPQWAAYEVTGSDAAGFAHGDAGLQFFFFLAPGQIELADVQVIGKQ